MYNLMETKSDGFYIERYKYVLDLVNASKGQEIKFRLMNVKMNKWLPFEKFTKSDFEYSQEVHRSILNNEIVFDIDIERMNEKGELDLNASIEEARKRALGVTDKLWQYDLTNYSIYYSGNKGFHIHLLIGNLDLTNDKLMKLAEIKSYDNDNFFKNLKLAICKLCDIEIGFDKEFSIDQAKFNKHTLIRMEGAINKKSNHWKSYITDKQLKEFKDNSVYKTDSCINKDYFKTKNNINRNDSEYIYKILDKQFEAEKNRVQVVNRYGKRNFKCNIDNYSKVFKHYYIKSQMHYVGRAYICFLYLMTEGKREESEKFYNKYLLDKTPAGRQEEFKFNKRFVDTWKQCEEAEKVGFYHILNNKCGISKEDFKTKLEEIRNDR